jgi:hypothetical protein
MALLELVETRPDWVNALGVALARPPGVPERRADEDPWDAEAQRGGRPRRISDDLAWLRQAIDEPERNGLRPLKDTAAVAAWEPAGGDDPLERLARLRERRVLEAAGFLLHEPEDVAL